MRLLRGRWWFLLPAGFLLAATLLVYGAVQLGVATDTLYGTLVKDPERIIPPGDVIVAPADGIVVYVRPIDDGQVPIVQKHRTSIPVGEFHRSSDTGPRRGMIVGIYMTTFGVHINRAPVAGRVSARHWYNGPDQDMSSMEKKLLLRSLIPGWSSLQKLFGLSLDDIVSGATHVTESARETLLIEGAFRCWVVRIADYFVGEVLTWVPIGGAVEKGDRIGMITWGSQTDLIVETPDPQRLEWVVKEGDVVRGGESILARIHP